MQNIDGSGNDYVHDANGNIVTSVNKGLSNITYDPFINLATNIMATDLTYGASSQRTLKNDTYGSIAYIHRLSDFPLMEKVNDGSSEVTKLYVYGPTGLLAVNDDEGWFFMLKDHLGSTRVVLNESNNRVSNYDYMPFGNIMRSSVNTDVSYQFTGQEYDTELSLHNFRARMYDSDLGMFYAVDPAGQGFSSFGYAGNNPINFIDKDGKIFIIDDILIGAAIGALISGASYSTFAGENWTWEGFGTSVGLGALGGGMSAGIGMIGGSLANNTAYSLLTNTITNATTTALSGNEITLSGMFGMVAGGIVGGAIPGYSGKGSSVFGNIFGELAHESVRGAIIGGTSGAVTSLARGENVLKGFGNGLVPGAIGGAVHAGAMISIFGSAYEPTYNIDAMESDMAMVGLGNGAYKPVFRTGGALKYIQGWIGQTRGVAFGRNLYVPGQDNSYTTFHEMGHYYQMNHAGWGYVLTDALFRGNYGRPGNVEWAADQLFKFYGR